MFGSLNYKRMGVYCKLFSAFHFESWNQLQDRTNTYTHGQTEHCCLSMIFHDGRANSIWCFQLKDRVGMKEEVQKSESPLENAEFLSYLFRLSKSVNLLSKNVEKSVHYTTYCTRWLYKQLSFLDGAFCSKSLHLSLKKKKSLGINFQDLNTPTFRQSVLSALCSYD